LSNKGSKDQLGEPDEGKLRLEAVSVGSGSNSQPSSTANTAISGLTHATEPAFRYVDRPEINETFSDSITGLFFDGQSLRIEFGVSRVNDAKPNSPLAGNRYPACRVVLTPTAAVELINRMQQIAVALAQAGVVKRVGESGERKQSG